LTTAIRSPRSSTRRSLLRRYRPGLDVGVVQVLFLPHHHHVDAIAARRVIVEHEFLERSGLELAVFAQMQCGFGETVRLTGGIYAEDVRLYFLRSRNRIGYGRRDQEEEGRKPHKHGKASRVVYRAHIPDAAEATGQNSKAPGDEGETGQDYQSEH